MRRHSSHLRLKGYEFSSLMDIILTANPLENSQNNFQRNSLNKIQSEMEVARRYNCFYTVDIVDIVDFVDIVDTVDTVYIDPIGSRTPEMDSNQSGAVGGTIWGPFPGSLTHSGTSRGLRSHKRGSFLAIF